MALSRGREALRLYTNSLDKLPDATQRASRKRAALELTERDPVPPERETTLAQPAPAAGMGHRPGALSSLLQPLPAGARR